MGIVARQTLKKTLIMYLGVAAGVVSTLFIYPLNLSLHGKIVTIIAFANFISPFTMLGAKSLAVRFFPDFKDKKTNHHGFFGVLLGIILTGFFLLVGILIFSKEAFYDFVQSQNWDLQNLIEKMDVVLLFTFSLMVINISTLYLTNFQRVVVPSLLDSLGMKLIIPALILSVYFGFIAEGQSLLLLAVAKTIIALGLIIYTWQLGQLGLKIYFNFLKKELINRMVNYAFYGILGSIGSILAFQIDTLMVASLVNFEMTSIYSIGLFIANVISIPSAAILALVGAQIATLRRHNDEKKINFLYKKSSISLFIAGTTVFLLVWWNLEDVFRLTSNYEKLIQAKPVILYLGLAKIFEMATGVNGEIIAYSKYFRVNLVLALVLGAATIILNLVLIPKFGYVGAAIATCISLTIFNILKYGFILAFFKYQPFTKASLYVLMIFGFTSFVFWILPLNMAPLTNILLRSTLILLLFLSPIIYLKLFPELNDLVFRTLRKLRF